MAGQKALTLQALQQLESCIIHVTTSPNKTEPNANQGSSWLSWLELCQAMLSTGQAFNSFQMLIITAIKKVTAILIAVIIIIIIIMIYLHTSSCIQNSLNQIEHVTVRRIRPGNSETLISPQSKEKTMRTLATDSCQWDI